MATNTEAQAPTETNPVPASETTQGNPQTDLASQPATAQHDQLEELLSNPDWTPETPTESKPQAGEQPQEAESAAKPGGDNEDDDDDHEERATAPDPKDNGKRYRFTDPADRQFAALRKEGVAPDEAARIAYGIGRAPTNAPAAGIESTQADPLAAWQEELAQVDEKLNAAGASEGMMSEEIVKLIQKRGDLVADIKAETRLRGREHQTAAAQARTVQQKSVDTAQERFPLLLVEGSAVRLEADRLLEQYRGSAFLNRADAPIVIGEQAAANVARAQAKANGSTFEVEMSKLEKGGSAATAATPAKTPGTTAKRITPASGANATQRPDKPATDEEKYRKASSSNNPKEQHAALEELLYGGN